MSLKLSPPYDSDKSISIIKAYLRKIIGMYLLWSAIYLPLAIYGFIIDTKNRPLIMYVFMYLRGLLLIGENYNSWMLWYLLSTIYALLLIIFLLRKHVPLPCIAFIGVIIFTVWHCLSIPAGHDGILSLVLSVFRNGRISSGMFYIPAGMLLAKLTFSKKPAYLLLAASFAAALLCDGLAKSFFIAVCAASLLVIVSGFRSDSEIYPFMRKMSTAIYFVHMYVWSICYTILYGRKTMGLGMFTLTVLISVLVSALYVYAGYYRKSGENRW